SISINPDQIIPVLFQEIFPPVVAALLSVTVISAVMSTSDGLIVSLTQLLAYDIFRKTIIQKLIIKKEKSENIVLMISRYATFLLILVCIWIAWSPPNYLSVSMWIGIGGIVSASAGPLVVGALWERATRKGAIFSLLAGTIVYWVV